jgi:hypothetical protein
MIAAAHIVQAKRKATAAERAAKASGSTERSSAAR